MRVKFFAAIVVIAMCCAFQVAFAEETKEKGNAMQEEMMKKWQAYMTPGDQQKALAMMAGTWDTSVKSYMEDPAKPTETKGTSTFASIMDGRYLQETAEGDFNGMPFHGMGVYGYDNAMKTYVGSWIDSMGTGIMSITGTSTDGGKTIHWKGSATNPMTGKPSAFRSVMHQVSDDEYHFEMYGVGMDGKMGKQMEITYTRKK